jgi:NAD(P)-dependent dehydrogenase (short-subunit alcohol dehydrogenase family)
MASRPLLEGRIALVTGAATRIGAAIATALSGAGAGVIVHASRSTKAAEALAAQLRLGGRPAWTVAGDLAAPGGCERVFAEVLAGPGHVDVLVNNAAVFERVPLLSADAEAHERTWRVNALAPALLIRQLAAHVAARPPSNRRPPAAVVNLLDQRISRPAAGCLPYYLSKCSLAALTRAAALELAPRVRVNAVAPGAVLAPEPPTAREPAGPVPLGARPTPEQVAEAVVWLACAQSVTGQILYVDGGQHLL